jgi:Uncharacterised nucleotidyltransferase
LSSADAQPTGSARNAGRGAGSAAMSSPPDRLATLLRDDGDFIIEGALLVVEYASADAVATLRRAGIRSILLKGPLQQRWLAEAGTPRASIDVDLLVARAEFEAAEKVIAANGYSTAATLPSDPGFDHARVWTAPDRVPIELHWTIVGADERRIWEVLADETETAQIAGELVEIPNEAARCLIVALHAAQHEVGAPQTLHDLERALTTAGRDVWVRGLELAVAVGAETAFVAALDLTARGLALRTALGLQSAGLTDRDVLELLTSAPTARGFYGLSRHRSAPAKARFLLAKLAPAPGFMRLRYPVARRGLPGLLFAYLYRLWWLARWSIPGLRSWRKSKQLVHDSRTRKP